MAWRKQNPFIPKDEIKVKVTEATVKFAEEFGEYLGRGDNKLTTNQLRKFFGEVKRQQMIGYNETEFVLLKPKLAYAVGRVKPSRGGAPKIKDFYEVMSQAIDLVKNESDFRNFIKVFEAIVAYHKAAEENIKFNY